MSELRYICPNRLAEMVGEENIIEMLGSYLNLLTVSLEQLESCREDMDLNTIRMTAHKMKSSTRMVGADELADYFAELERLAHDEKRDLRDISTMLLCVQGSARHVEQEINHYISELG